MYKYREAEINNKIFKINKEGQKSRVFWIKGLRVKFKGSNSTILIYEPLPKLRKSLIEAGDNCNVVIKSSPHEINRLQIYATANNSVCCIGQNFSCTNRCQILLHLENNLTVNIGDNCLFGSNIILRTSDGHSIINNENKIVNYGQSINIGEHCWLAANVTVLKGVTIADNCVIGTGSLITKNCPDSNALYAGIPAKIVKRNITWDSKRPS